MASKEQQAAARKVIKELLAYGKRWEDGGMKDRSGIESIDKGSALHSAVVELESFEKPNCKGNKPLPLKCWKPWVKLLMASREHRGSAVHWCSIFEMCIAVEYIPREEQGTYYETVDQAWWDNYAEETDEEDRHGDVTKLLGRIAERLDNISGITPAAKT